MAASGSYAHLSSAASHVCLTFDPDIGPVSKTPFVSSLYGTEYEEKSFGTKLLVHTTHFRSVLWSYGGHFSIPQ
jgi:hypothetical protein